ncbi:MAG: hypothetical protein LPK45_06750 [Bacteroidota bacterium]|nr:hypothetical protein [Bacteroidota bacterium]MDX5430772.1 hypothetical protein [Bacteroidota bacterium]MDX5469517.1 hypothetical protein [Bacteroidota bacterium]
MGRLRVMWNMLQPVARRFAYQKGWKKIAGFQEEFGPLMKGMPLAEQQALYRRFTEYYVILGFALHSMTTWWGRKATAREKKVAFYLAMASPVYDDLNDLRALTHEEMVDLMNRADSDRDALENLLVYCCQQAEAHYAQGDKFWDLLNRVGRLQDESLHQKGRDLSDEEILSITTEKGAYAFLFIFHAFEHAMDAKEEEAVFQLGRLFQLSDDILDIYHDAREGIRTYPLSGCSLSDLRAKFLEWNQLVEKAFHTLPYPSELIEAFILQIRLVTAPVMVALDQYESLMGEQGEVLKPEEYTRQELICDMEKPRNIGRALRYYWFGFVK